MTTTTKAKRTRENKDSELDGLFINERKGASERDDLELNSR